MCVSRWCHLYQQDQSLPLCQLPPTAPTSRQPPARPAPFSILNFMFCIFYFTGSSRLLLLDALPPPVYGTCP